MASRFLWGLSVKKFILPILGASIVLYVLSAANLTPSQPVYGQKNLAADKSSQALDNWVIPGRTQCSAGRKGILAPAVLHPVTQVMVSLGETVKKGQHLIQIDDDEPQADVRVKKANLENTGIAAREARRYLVNLEKLHTQGAIGEQKIHDARATALKSEADERAAKAALDVALAELEHYVVDAPIDGVVNRLEVCPGMVSRPGTTDWGEILDLKEIDVRVALSPAQADLVKIGDEAEVLRSDLTTSYGTGRVMFIGLAANPHSGTIPALIRIANSEGRLRCEIPVQVRLLQNRQNPK